MFKKTLLAIMGTVFLFIATAAQAILLEFDPEEQHVKKNVPFVDVGNALRSLAWASFLPHH